MVSLELYSTIWFIFYLGRKKIQKIKAEKLSVAISIKEEVEEDAQANDQTHVIENIVNETITINDHQEINEDKGIYSD